MTRLQALLERNRLGELLVITGALTPGELQAALAAQRQENLPLGRILIQGGFVRRSQIYRALAHQFILRALAGFVGLTILMYGMMSKAKAENMPQGVQQVSMSVAASAYAPLVHPEQLFAGSEKKSTNLEPFTKWSSVFQRFQDEIDRPENAVEVAQWKRDLVPMLDISLEEKARRINEMVNKVAYLTDDRNWGIGDYWTTPIEFFARGGDCEDYAIAKYVFLRALGVPEERLRVAIVHDMEKDIPHAVLVVYDNNRAYVLDNQTQNMWMASDAAARYRPIFSINRTAWWLHNLPQTVVASAN